MNVAPSNFPRLAGAASLSKPGFDILLAVSCVRQSALPTVRMLSRQAEQRSRYARVGALARFLNGSPRTGEQYTARPVRFFDLPEDGNGLPETMNGLFTRGFQPMLNPSALEGTASVNPIPPDVETME